ncbi:polypeptide N-acetylgalactosaminyltransferase 15-like [Hippoglossus hippoglossus]|uniref:polypeptide N-acetylgalactosaminyltransferase 15-like n=1 Tax=Hippoglossus hippoglossus TaxID=8267 RepID=UPI00148E6595|nr:polypeptide N-acetylgalactosaminyltransferase 15-like [Hippoglossus hippoglossus]XP_034456516.1 polypeptide N-acetylgalactosaminyltransferase 15-like [Hippoglossus hippoglossus]
MQLHSSQSRMRLCRATARRRMLCLWLLLLGFALVTLTLSDLLNRDKSPSHPNPGPPRRPLQRSPSPPDLEVIVDSRDPALELGVDLSPLKSFQEDQLLFVPMPSTQGTGSAPQKKGSYKVLLPGAYKDNIAPAPPTHGELGQAVRLPLEGVERETEVAAVMKYGFNEVASERISLHRGLPESRHPGCLGEQYSESLPSASVVICFHDEAWSTLLRTVHSVLNTAPKQHLHEVLLVDDLSQQGHLKTVLSEYLSHLDGVRLIRSTRRLGVGGCRTLGAARAAAEVLVFMDSHCECQKGWLEPLLERVAQDRSRVVSPIMDVIDWQTLQYNATRWPVRGVFDWKLDFFWESNLPLPDKDPDSAVQPLRTPALGGGVVAIDRHFFQKIGAYDPGMLLWGAEQIELSIRVWSCGGSMEVVPCSRVAHLMHHHLPYRFPDQELLQRNKIRIADTWMDTYRKIFYRRDTLAHFIRQSESPNITERLRLKRSLGCRNFHWYLTTVYPQLYVPQDRPALSGELYNVGTGSCADYPRGQGAQGGPMKTAPCSGTGSQHCDLNSEGEVRWGPMGALCLDSDGERVVLSPCPTHRPTSSRLQWKFMKLNGQLIHQQSQLCLEAVKQVEPPQSRPREVNTHISTGGLLLRPCTHHPKQQWHFEQLVAPKGE